TGLVVRVHAFGENLLFPHLTKFFSAHGFGVRRVGDTLPEAISIPNSVVIATTVAAVVGFALLALLIGNTLSASFIRGPAAAPLLFGLIALGLTVCNREIQLAERYLLPMLPTVLLLGLAAVKPTRCSRALLVGGVLVLAGWSIWWER